MSPGVEAHGATNQFEFAGHLPVCTWPCGSVADGSVEDGGLLVGLFRIQRQQFGFLPAAEPHQTTGHFGRTAAAFGGQRVAVGIAQVAHPAGAQIGIVSLPDKNRNEFVPAGFINDSVLMQRPGDGRR